LLHGATAPRGVQMGQTALQSSALNCFGHEATKARRVECSVTVIPCNRLWPVLQGPATIAKAANTALLGSEAVEQPVAAGAAEVALAATAIGSARGMR
jgi:hypothetical protein